MGMRFSAWSFLPLLVSGWESESGLGRRHEDSGHKILHFQAREKRVMTMPLLRLLTSPHTNCESEKKQHRGIAAYQVFSEWEACLSDTV